MTVLNMMGNFLITAIVPRLNTRRPRAQFCSRDRYLYTVSRVCKYRMPVPLMHILYALLFQISENVPTPIHFQHQVRDGSRNLCHTLSLVLEARIYFNRETMYKVHIGVVLLIKKYLYQCMDSRSLFRK